MLPQSSQTPGTSPSGESPVSFHVRRCRDRSSLTTSQAVNIATCDAGGESSAYERIREHGVGARARGGRATPGSSMSSRLSAKARRRAKSSGSAIHSFFHSAIVGKPNDFNRSYHLPSHRRLKRCIRYMNHRKKLDVFLFTKSEIGPVRQADVQSL